MYETGEEAKGHCPLGTSLCGKPPPVDPVCCSSSCLVEQGGRKSGHAVVGRGYRVQCIAATDSDNQLG